MSLSLPHTGIQASEPEHVNNGTFTPSLVRQYTEGIEEDQYTQVRSTRGGASPLPPTKSDQDDAEPSASHGVALVSSPPVAPAPPDRRRVPDSVSRSAATPRAVPAALSTRDVAAPPLSAATEAAIKVGSWGTITRHTCTLAHAHNCTHAQLHTRTPHLSRGPAGKDDGDGGGSPERDDTS